MGEQDPDSNSDAYTDWLLHLASDHGWPALSVEARLNVGAGLQSWRWFLAEASNAEKMLAGRVLQTRARLNGRRTSALWR